MQSSTCTGEALGFSEWKGSPLLRISPETVADAPAEFKRDMLELLDILCDPECPHPYDGVVAGSIA